MRRNAVTLLGGVLAAACLLSGGMAEAQQRYPMTLLNLTVPSDATASAAAIWSDDISSNNAFFVAQLGRPSRPGLNSPFYVYETVFQTPSYKVTVGLASAASLCKSGPNSAVASVEPQRCPLRVTTRNLATGATTRQEFLNACLLVPEINDLPSGANGTVVGFDGTSVTLDTLLKGASVSGCALKAAVMAP